MSSALRKMGLYLGLVEDDEHVYDEEYDDYDVEEPLPVRRAPEAARPVVHSSSVRPVDDHRSGRVATVEASRPMGATRMPPAEQPSYRITTLHPRTYNEARTIGEQFREGTPVIMNLTQMDDGDAKRLVDFAAGLTFGLRGSIERVTNKVFLLSPANVEVTAEDKALIAESGFFNQS